MEVAGRGILMTHPRAPRIADARHDRVADGALLQRGILILGGNSLGADGFLLITGTLAGTVGSAGGIASLISYPALLAVGLPALPANVADTIASVAMLPGSALASRPELQGQGPRVLRLAPVALLGSGAGAVLLLLTPGGVFSRIVPFLVALPALMLLVQPRVSAWLGVHHSHRGRFLSPLALFAVWVYQGYWGVGVGVMTLTVITLAVETHLARANALKNVLLGVADVACSAVFVLYGPVRWTAVVPLAFGFLAGSRVGPSLARQIPGNVLRVVVALCGLGLALYLWLNPS